MANANNAAPPQPRVPLNDPPGVLPLFDFFKMVMRNSMIGFRDEAAFGRGHTEALGFESTGPIIMKHMCDDYTEIMQTESMGFGENSPPDATPLERAEIHYIWCNHVVPKALRHAHAHLKHQLDADPANPDWVNPDGHTDIVKVFLALLDTTMESAFANPLLRDAMNEANMDTEIEVHANHYERVFRRRAEPMIVFNMRFYRTSNTNV